MPGEDRGQSQLMRLMWEWCCCILYNQMSELAVKAKSLTDETDLVISLLFTEANDMSLLTMLCCMR